VNNVQQLANYLQFDHLEALPYIAPPSGCKVGSLHNLLVPEDLGMRQAITQLEQHLIHQVPEATTDVDAVLPLVHHFAPHMYGREIFLPTESLVVGKLHRHSHLNVLMKGHVLVATEDGVEELIAPCVWTSKAGIKRVVYTLEEAIWLCVHPTETTDLDEIEENTIAKSYAAIGKVDPDLPLTAEGV